MYKTFLLKNQTIPHHVTVYIKEFLNTKNIESVQADLGIEVIFKLPLQSFELWQRLKARGNYYFENSICGIVP